MSRLLVSVAVVTATLAAVPVLAADPPMDYPDYPEVNIPPVDYNIGGSFYLRGSAAVNLQSARQVRHGETWGDLGGQVTHNVDSLGYGYSWGVGFGYETGDGLRVDATIDTLETTGVGITKAGLAAPDINGSYKLTLRSTVALANAYYDFGLGGGAFGYVGAGAGAAWNRAEANVNPDNPADSYSIPNGGNISAAAAIMAGVGYDMGSWVADVGYRGLYIHEINNLPTDPATFPGLAYAVDNNFIHELRGTVRYRFN